MCRTLGIGLRQGPRGVRFLMSEVPPVGRTTICSQVDILGLWYKLVNFGVNDNYGYGPWTGPSKVVSHEA